MKRKHEIVERVQRTLTYCGWPTMDGTAIAHRDFSTAVGIKKALVYLAFFGPDAQGVMLQGDYWSEGRNVIPCDLLPTNASDDVLDAQVRRFAMSAESAVLGSFAARLLHL
jgi:hypothetical protein